MIRPASVVTLSPSYAVGTTSLTNPQASAVAASIGSPVNSICSDRLRPMARLISTIGVEQNSPIFTPRCGDAAAAS